MNEATSPKATLSRRNAATAAIRGKSIPPQMEFGGGKPPVHEPRSPKSPFLRRPASAARGATLRQESASTLRPASSYQSLNMTGILNLAESVNKKIKEFRDTIKDGSKTLASRKPKEAPKRPPRRRDRMRLSAAFATLPKNFKSSSRDLDVIEEDQVQPPQATNGQKEQKRQEQESEKPRIPQPGSSPAAAELAKSKSQGDIGGASAGPSPSRLIPSVAMPGSPESSVTLSAPSHTPCAMSSLASPSPLEPNGVVR